jgi:hypothetical protein
MVPWVSSCANIGALLLTFTKVGLTEDEKRKYRTNRKYMSNKLGRLEKRERAVRIYPVLDALPPRFNIQKGPATANETTEGVAAICVSRFSSPKSPDLVEATYDGNDVVLGKFIRDFIAPIPVLNTETIVWNGRKAWFPLPWAALPNAAVQAAQQGEADLENELADAAWCAFFDRQVDYTTTFVVHRGIDGSSIDPGSWVFLRWRYPKLNIILAFSCSERFVVKWDPNKTYFGRLEPHDGRLYAFLSLSTLVDHISGRAQDATAAWVVDQWRMGRVHRQQVSMAYQTGNVLAISNAISQFVALCTSHRHRLPRL